MNIFEDSLLAPRQVGLERLRDAVQSATDPLDIVNCFMCIPSSDVPMLPAYWEQRICALAEMIVDSRNNQCL